jgi:molecular chaperone DnaK (HSP70)
VSFLAESTAAAMCYGLLVAGAKTVLVFDMGGGTLDITIMRIDNGNVTK